MSPRKAWSLILLFVPLVVQAASGVFYDNFWTWRRVSTILADSVDARAFNASSFTAASVAISGRLSARSDSVDSAIVVTDFDGSGAAGSLNSLDVTTRISSQSDSTDSAKIVTYLAGADADFLGRVSALSDSADTNISAAYLKGLIADFAGRVSALSDSVDSAIVVTSLIGTAADATFRTTTQDTLYIGTVRAFAKDSSLIIGTLAGDSLTTAKTNLFIGYNAGASDSSGNHNVFVGPLAGSENTMGDDGVFIGYLAGNRNTSGSANTYVGSGAGYANTGAVDGNVAVGYGAGLNNSADSCVFLGNLAGALNATAHTFYLADDSTRTRTLIYGEFDNDYVRFPDSGFVEYPRCCTLALMSATGCSTLFYVGPASNTLTILPYDSVIVLKRIHTPRVNPDSVVVAGYTWLRSPDVLIDQGTLGADRNSPTLTLSANRYTGAVNYPEEAKLQVLYGADPYLRISVDSSHTEGLSPVIDIHDQAITASITGYTDLGAAANAFKDLHLTGDAYIGDSATATISEADRGRFTNLWAGTDDVDAMLADYRDHITFEAQSKSGTDVAWTTVDTVGWLLKYSWVDTLHCYLLAQDIDFANDDSYLRLAIGATVGTGVEVAQAAYDYETLKLDVTGLSNGTWYPVCIQDSVNGTEAQVDWKDKNLLGLR